MDVCESDQVLQKHSSAETRRPTLGSAEKNNGTTRQSKTREVSSRYKSPTPSAASGPRRCPSPRTSTAPTVSVPKRAISAERRRPCTPPSPPSPSTPAQDTTAVIQLASRKLMGSRMPEALWPSTMRSLSVSFQSDNSSVPTSKRPATNTLSDRTLRSSSNITHKQTQTTPPTSRKPTPERKRSPLKGKNAPDQSENSKPVDGTHGRAVDQHRWPSRVGGRISTSALTKSVDLTDKTTKISITPNPVVPSLRRMSLPGCLSKPLQPKVELAPCSVDDNVLRKPKVVSSKSSERLKLVTPTGWSLSLPSPGSRPASPNKTSPVSRGASPSRTKAVTPTPSRGSSPSRTRPSSPSTSRPSSPSRQSSPTTSVLSYIADIRKGKKVANHIEDVHQLRLLYNRHLQWQFANAQADDGLDSQKATAEVWIFNLYGTSETPL